MSESEATKTSIVPVPNSNPVTDSPVEDVDFPQDEEAIAAEELEAERALSKFMAYVERHSGPLPDPRTLRLYQEVDPEALKWILRSATKEQNHRHWCDREPLRQSGRAQWLAFVLSILVVIAGTLLIFNDKSAAGLATILVPLASILGVFIYREVQASKAQVAESRVEPRPGSDRTG